MSSFQSLAAHYKTLGVSRDTPWAQVKEAHRELISAYHPDRLSSSDPRRGEFEERAKQLNNAFQEISNSRKIQASRPKVSNFTKSEIGLDGVKRPRAKTVERMVVVRDGVVYSVKKMRRTRVSRFVVFAKNLAELKAKAGSSFGLLVSALRGEHLRGASAASASLVGTELNVADFAWADSQADQVVHFVDGKRLVRNGSYLS